MIIINQETSSELSFKDVTQSDQSHFYIMWMFLRGTELKEFVRALHCFRSQLTSETLLWLRENRLPAKCRSGMAFAGNTAITVEQRPHPVECEWPLSCVSKATRRWKLYRWNNSPPLQWPIWSQAPSTTWGFIPMSSTASAVNQSPLRPKQVRPHLVRWNQGSSQVGYSGCKSVGSGIHSNSVKAGWVPMVYFIDTMHVLLKVNWCELGFSSVVNAVSQGICFDDEMWT